MSRGIDSRFDARRRPIAMGPRTANLQRHMDELGLGVNESLYKEVERSEIENMMSEHPTGMPTPKVLLKNNNMRPGTSTAEIKGDTKTYTDPSKKKK